MITSELAHPGREGRPHHGLHLHALQHEHRGAGGDQVADRDGRGDHERRSRRAQHATLVAGDPMGHPVDLDQVDRAVGGGDQPVELAVDDQPAVELVEPLHLRHDDVLDAAGEDAHPEPLRADLHDRDLVGRTPELEVDRPADLVLDLGTPAVGALEQPGDLDLHLVLVGLDAGRDQCDARVLVDDEPALGADPVDPARCRPSHPCRRSTSGWSSRSRMKLLLVAPPSITTVVSAIARRSRASASSRVRP